MLKTCKKALLLTLIFAMLCPLNSLGAAITWDTSDMTDEVVLFENNFDGTNTGVEDKFLDKATFADTEHKTVLSIGSEILYLTNDSINKYILAGKAINVQFDFRATDTDILRFEFRRIAKEQGSTNELALGLEKQQKYWTGDATYKKIENDGVWHSFNGTFDVASYLADLKNNPNFGSFAETGASLFIIGKDKKTVYIDNLKVSAAQVPMPVNTAAVKAKWEKQADADGHTDIYKSTVNVNEALARSCAFTGFAPGYFKTNEEYRISFSFKEDANNANVMTRMWRMCNSDAPANIVNSTVKVNDDAGNATANLYYNNNSAAISKGTWYTVNKTFTVGKAGSNSAGLAGNGLFALYWESRGSEDGFAYDATLNGNYTIYIADFKIERVKGASENSNTVEFAEKQYVAGGSSLSVAVSGYFNTNVYPKIMLGETTYVGEWKDVVTDGMLRTGTAYFSDVKSGDNFINDTYSVNLLIEDIWGKVKTNSLIVYFEKAQTQQVDVVRGSWVNIPLNHSSYDVTTNAQRINTSGTGIAQYIKNGKGLIRFSFDAQGESGKTYSNDVAVDVRNENLVDLKLTIPQADLSDGASHSYSKIIDFGSLGRYGKVWGSDGKALAWSRIDNDKYYIFLRNSSDGTIHYKNIKLEYFDPDAASKDYVAARLSIKNNAEDRFSPKGVLIIAKYEGNTLVSVQFKNIDFKDTEVNDGKGGKITLGNALGKDEEVTVYITGHDAADNTANELEVNDSRYSHKAFYWNNFDDMIPLAVSEAE